MEKRGIRMTNKELQEKLKEYPDDAPVCFSTVLYNVSSARAEVTIMDIDEVIADGGHIILRERVTND